VNRGNEGKLSSHSSFQKWATTGPAGPQVSARASADDHGHALCQRCSPTFTTRMQYMLNWQVYHTV